MLNLYFLQRPIPVRIANKGDGIDDYKPDFLNCAGVMLLTWSPQSCYCCTSKYILCTDENYVIVSLGIPRLFSPEQ